MKNIHVLPTDKPSRLRYFNGTLQLMYLVPKKSDITFQHIYITNSEEIKEGDWVFNFEYIYIVQYDSKKHDSKFWYKKIILTTDQDLIKDGVQPIDDEFLEWFVKNPSCEEVNVKESLIVNVTDFGYKIIIPHEEPKQETLEEAAETWNEHQTTLEFGKPHNAPNRIKAFIAGAKWQQEHYGLMEIELSHTKTLLASCEKALEERDKQQERMYSEEELKNAFKIGFNIGYGSPVQELDLKNEHCERWFEQFKKK